MASKGRPTPPAVSPIAHWQERSQGIIKTLPSGAHVRIKRPSLFALARVGHVPNPLLEAVLPHLVEPGHIETEPETSEERVARYRENAETYARIAALALAEPRVVLDRSPDYAQGEIAPEDLSTADMIWIYNYIVFEVELALGGPEHASITFSQPDDPGGAA